MLLNMNIIEVLYLVPVILISLSFHEFSHAFVSYMLGDPTAKNQGRLTLNPMKHLDAFGTIMMLIARFGWAKPVPINPMYYKNRKSGTMIVSLAGPVSNVFLAVIFSFPLLYINAKYGSQDINSFSLNAIIFNLSLSFFINNLRLAVFNILPVPPLDGSKILSGILPQRQYFTLMQYENYIGIGFLILMFVFPGFLNRILGPIVNLLIGVIQTIVNPIIKMLI